MFERLFWSNEIQEQWKKVPIVWLTGVRRAGKTTLCQTIQNAMYLNCDLPQTANIIQDPEFFFRSVRHPIVIFDEIHQLPDPSRLLKIGADAFPHLKILATGSSTLAATRKFRDTLTGRKRSVVLLPVLWDELTSFGNTPLKDRLFRGGLPPALLAPKPDEGFYAEWLDSYFARDVQELFRVERRTGFLRLLEAVLRQSGGMAEATTLSRMCELSRPTILNYLEVFQLTHVIHVLRPYHGGGKQEIVRQPKIYGFDTGFVRYAKGWNELREEDAGLLWEHLVLDVLMSLPNAPRVQYWRDKQKNEVDFILPQGRDMVDAVECKWNAASFDPKGIRNFRQTCPKGRNFVVSPTVTTPYTKKMEGADIVFASAGDMRQHLLSVENT